MRRVCLRQLSGSEAGRFLEFEQSVIRIGRRPGLEFVFDAQRDLDVSGEHAEIRYEKGEYVLLDQGSRNGTWVNNIEVRRHILRSGDKINFGRGGPALRFEMLGEVDRPKPALTVIKELASSRKVLASAASIFVFVLLLLLILSEGGISPRQQEIAATTTADALYRLSPKARARGDFCLAVAVDEDLLATTAQCAQSVATNQLLMVGRTSRVAATQIWRFPRAESAEEDLPSDTIALIRVRKKDVDAVAFASVEDLTSVRRGRHVLVARPGIEEAEVGRVWKRGNEVFMELPMTAPPGAPVYDGDARLVGIIVASKDGQSTAVRAESLAGMMHGIARK